MVAEVFGQRDVNFHALWDSFGSCSSTGEFYTSSVAFAPIISSSAASLYFYITGNSDRGGSCSFSRR